MASKADQNGAAAHGLSHQHLGAAGAFVAGTMLTAEMAAMRNIQCGPSVTHLLPPQASSSSSSSSPSSSSPLSGHSDVILTGIYASCFDASAQNRTGTKSLPLHTEMELPGHDRTDAALHRTTIAAAMQRKAPMIPNSSALKPFTSRDSAVIAPSWAKPCRTSQPPSWNLTPPPKNVSGTSGPCRRQHSNSACFDRGWIRRATYHGKCSRHHREKNEAGRCFGDLLDCHGNGRR